MIATISTHNGESTSLHQPPCHLHYHCRRRHSPSQHLPLCTINTHTYTNNNLRGKPPQYAPAPVILTFDLLTFKVVSESRVMWATSVPILVILGLSVLDLGPVYVTDRQTSDAHHRLMPPLCGWGHKNATCLEVSQDHQIWYNLIC